MVSVPRGIGTYHDEKFRNARVENKISPHFNVITRSKSILKELFPVLKN